MTRNARATFLILALLWQALVWLTPYGQEQKIVALANTMAHAQTVSHHHHDDHSLHLDGHVADVSQHQHTNEALQVMGLVPPVNGFTLDRPSSTKILVSASPIADVYLHGPLRPPQLIVS